MVRRLIQRFLHWLRRLLAQKPGAKQRPQPLRQQLPPVKPPAAPAPPAALSTGQSPPRPGGSPGNTDDFDKTLDQTPAPLNPASPRVTTSSRFKVLLSDYEYSPSSAVQDLNRQLSAPKSPADDLDGLRQQQQIADAATAPLPQNKIAPPSPKPVEQQIKKQPAWETKPSPDMAKLSPEQESNNAPPTSTRAKLDQTPKGQLPEPKQAPEPDIAQAADSQAPVQATPGLIIKQGVIKLLFKLKKNNHHGYIAPDDGSKDIIFHQKFIGHEIFSQLERGMKVEVTAHITEGKAYADHVRIL